LTNGSPPELVEGGLVEKGLALASTSSADALEMHKLFTAHS